MSSVLDSITAGTNFFDSEEALSVIKQRVSDAKEMFSGLQSAFLQRKYLVENFQLVVNYHE